MMMIMQIHFVLLWDLVIERKRKRKRDTGGDGEKRERNGEKKKD